jgi:hypothetical protein
MKDRSERETSPKPSMVEDLLSRAREFVAGMIADTAKRSVEDLLRWILGRAVLYAVSAALFIMAAAFLLWGATQALLTAGLPSYGSYLVVGLTGLLAGLVTLKCGAQRCGTK